MGRENVGHSESYAKTHSTYQTYFRRMLCRKKKYQEVAEELNISVSAVRKHIVKALQVIRKECLINHKEGV